MLTITERQFAGVTILYLEGNVIMGSGSMQLRDAIHRLTAEGKRKILLNMARVKYIDSSGVGELVSSSAALTHRGGHLKLLSLSEKVEEVMALSGLLSIFEVYENESEALKEYLSSG